MVTLHASSKPWLPGKAARFTLFPGVTLSRFGDYAENETHKRRTLLPLLQLPDE